MNAVLASDYEYNNEHMIWTRRGASDRFGYSDGDAVESRLYGIVKAATDKSVASRQLAASITDWATLYHLTSSRANVLRPVMHNIEGPVLEIGSGCGAITRFLGEQGLEVYAVEGSVRRASIGAERCKDLPNVKVFAEPFQTFDIGLKFKTITLIGVLEYARMFYGQTRDGRDPIDLMLERVSSFLAPGGKLVIAIENQLGLKYFAGFSEDHLGQPMVGIEDRYTSKTAVTFGKKDLARRVGAAGLGHYDWWYPFPDYKIPVSVLSEDAFAPDVPADFSSLISEACGSDFQAPKVQNFSMDFAWRAIARNGLAGDLANSFVLVASASEIAKSDAIGYHYGGPRDHAYKKVVKFGRDDTGYYVERYKLDPDATPAASNSADLFLSLGREPMRTGDIWRGELRYIMARDGWNADEVAHWTSFWWKAFTEEAGRQRDIDSWSAATLVPGSLFDAIPRNLVVDWSGSSYFIDQEWCANRDLEAGYILFRALYDAILGVRFCGNPGTDTRRELGWLIIAVARRLGLSIGEADLARYIAEESHFQSIVGGRPFQLSPELVNHAVPSRILPLAAVRHLEQVLKARDAEIAKMIGVSQQMRQKVGEVGRILETQLSEAHALIAEKDAEIARLRGQRVGAA